jgi:hypothetical protein
MMWLDDITAEIEAYAESLGITSPEVDIDNYWRAGQGGSVKIDAPTPTGGAWASQEYRLPKLCSRDEVRPIIVRAEGQLRSTCSGSSPRSTEITERQGVLQPAWQAWPSLCFSRRFLRQDC